MNEERDDDSPLKAAGAMPNKNVGEMSVKAPLAAEAEPSLPVLSAAGETDTSEATFGSASAE